MNGFPDSPSSSSSSSKDAGERLRCLAAVANDLRINKNQPIRRYTLGADSVKKTATYASRLVLIYNLT